MTGVQTCALPIYADVFRMDVDRAVRDRARFRSDLGEGFRRSDARRWRVLRISHGARAANVGNRSLCRGAAAGSDRDEVVFERFTASNPPRCARGGDLQIGRAAGGARRLTSAMIKLGNGGAAAGFALAFVLVEARAQQPTPSPSPTPTVFSAQTLAELKQLQDAALKSDYAYRQVAHLSNNIGPRLSGSAQAAKAVEYFGSEMKTLGLEVKLEKVMVPHWVRGEETAALVEFPGQAKDTTQKIVLTALGGSVATPPEGLTAEVVVVRDFDELESLGRANSRQNSRL